MAKNRWRRNSLAANAEFWQTPRGVILTFLLGVLFFAVVCLSAVDTIKWMGMILLIAAIAVIWLKFSVVRERIGVPLIALTLLAVMNGISTLYATSGKFALNEFLKILVAYCIGLILLAFAPGEGKQPARWIATILEVGTALAGLVSIDLLSTRLISTPVLKFLGLFSDAYLNLSAVEAGIRMTSIFDAPNIFAGFAGLGVLLSLHLACSTEQKKERAAHTCCLYVNSLAFLLAFSMGASASIAVAFLAYLLLERKGRRGGLFILMVETLVLCVISAGLISMTSFDAWDGFQVIPLLCAVVGAAALCLLHEFAGRRVAEKMEGRSKLMLGLVAGVLAVLVVFVIAAVSLTGAANLQSGESLRRAAYPEPGSYTMAAETDGPVYVIIESQNQQETMMHTSTELYRGSLTDAAFDVPEDSLVVYFNFSVQQDVVLEEVTYQGENGSDSLPLNYTLLPGFIANRLQGLFANENAIQRLVFFEDGLKLFKRSPIVGSGLGVYENAIVSVQSFFYETKYAHNHYIQALAETGVIGFVLFVGLLVLSAVAVWRDRRKEDGHPMTPVLGAALCFMAIHAATEVVFSSYAYLPVAYAVFVLINLCCGKAIPVPALSNKVRTGGMAAVSALLVAFGFLLGGNMMAYNIVQRNASFSTVKQAISLDKFEWADYMLSYVNSARQVDASDEIMQQADEYALRLAKVNSNAIPIYLAQYYFDRGDVDQAFKMLEKYADYVSADPDTWNEIFSLLAMYENDTEQYRAGVTHLKEMLDTWNAENMGSISLSEGLNAFLNRVCG